MCLKPSVAGNKYSVGLLIKKCQKGEMFYYQLYLILPQFFLPRIDIFSRLTPRESGPSGEDNEHPVRI